MRKLRLLVTTLVLLSLASNARGEDPSASSEYLVKAGFIYNFASLVQWPSNAFANSNSPIVIGILGDDPFGPVIDRVLDGKRVDGRGFVIKRLKAAGDRKGCHILFVSSSETAHLRETIQMVQGEPVLTIGELPNFAKRGGMINLTLEGDRIRFEVNVEAAKKADLNISSRLLALATIVQQPDGRRAE